MSYVAQTDLLGLVPDEYLEGATDDEASGDVDTAVWAAVATSVDEEIDGRLAASYTTPVSPVPSVIKAAAKVLAAYRLYARRGVDESRNPFTDEVKYWREKLDRIGLGKEPLTYDADQANEPAILISEPSRTHSEAGNLLS